MDGGKRGGGQENCGCGGVPGAAREGEWRALGPRAEVGCAGAVGAVSHGTRRTYTIPGVPVIIVYY